LQQIAGEKCGLAVELRELIEEDVYCNAPGRGYIQNIPSGRTTTAIVLSISGK